MLLQRMRNLANRVIPEPLRLAPVSITLDSGVAIRVDSAVTLGILLELFITGPYTSALELAGPMKFVVDLGANRGLFPLLVEHHLRKSGRPDCPEFLCVEAAEANYHRLVQQLSSNGFVGRSTAVHGAVCGKRTGTVSFFYTSKRNEAGCIVNRRSPVTVRCPVADLSALTRNRPIDLLKMDIEGAEEGVLEEYGDVFEKTGVFVAEFHLHYVDHARCKRLLESRGLRFHERTWSYQDKLAVEVYAR